MAFNLYTEYVLYIILYYRRTYGKELMYTLCAERRIYDSGDGEGTQQQYAYNIYVVQTKRMTGIDSGTGSWHTRYHKYRIINV